MHMPQTTARGPRGAAPSRGRTQLGPALALIHGGRAPTRAALGARLGVTRATAGAVAAELPALRLIRVDTAPGGGTLGRPSHRLTIDPDGPVAFAAQVHPDGFAVALVGLGGRVVAADGGSLAVPGDPERVLAAAARAGARLLRPSGRVCVGGAPAVPAALAQPGGVAGGPPHVRSPPRVRLRDTFTAQA